MDVFADVSSACLIRRMRDIYLSSVSLHYQGKGDGSHQTEGRSQLLKIAIARMKIYYGLLWVLLPSLAFAQKQYDIPKASSIPIDSVTRMAIFQEVVSVDTSASIEELANRAKSWADRTYSPANRTLEEYDIFTGVLVVKAVLAIEYLHYQLTLGLKSKKQLAVYHTIRVEAKKGQCQITIEEFNTKKPDYRDQSGQLISPKLTPYKPTQPDDKIELVKAEMTLAKQYNDASDRPKRNAPFYLATERNIDAAIYKACNQILSSFKKAIRTK